MLSRASTSVFSKHFLDACVTATMTVLLTLMGPARLSLGCPLHQRCSACTRREVRNRTLIQPTRVNLRPRARCYVDVSEALISKLSTLHATSRPDASPERCRAVAVTALTERFEKVLLHSNGKNCFATMPSLYMLLGAEVGVDTELFSDVVNSTGVFPKFFSEHLEDAALFGACGRWTRSVDWTVTTGVANPPFDNRIIEDVIAVFDENVKREAPYFRAAVLPITKGGTVLRALQCGKIEGKVVILFPPGHLGFRPYSDFYTCDAWRDSYVPNSRIHLSLIIWCNSSYANHCSAPLNLEQRFRQWVHDCCREPGKVQVFDRRLASMFPLTSRGPQSADVPGCEDCSICLRWNSFQTKK